MTLVTNTLSPGLFLLCKQFALKVAIVRSYRLPHLESVHLISAMNGFAVCDNVNYLKQATAHTPNGVSSVQTSPTPEYNFEIQTDYGF